MRKIGENICGYILTMRVISIAVFSMLIVGSCKKLVDVNAPVTSVTDADVYSSDASAIAVSTGLFTKLSGAGYPSTFDISSSSLALGLSADEFSLWNGESDNKLIAYYTNALSSNPNFDAGSDFWFRMYENIYICNSAIEKLNATRLLTQSVRDQLLGESKFMRAFFYFYLVNLYGDVPLVLTTDYKINSTLSRIPKEQVYEQIILDLKEAKNVLSDKYLDITLQNETNERVRPTKWAAAALLSRVYLFVQDWANAEKEASEIINNTLLYGLLDVPLNDVFHANSREAIWQLQPVSIGYVTNTWDAKFFIIPPTGFSNDNPVYLSRNLFNEFENGDQRKNAWTQEIILDTDTFHYSYKYKVNEPDAPVSEYLTMLRLSEQYLIRGEARIQLNQIAAGIADLNVVRERATDDNAPIDNRLKQLPVDLSKSEALGAVEHERQVELFCEQGIRWLDLKRTGRVNVVMAAVTLSKGGSWNTNWQWYPIPFSDIQKNNKLIQNKGY